MGELTEEQTDKIMELSETAGDRVAEIVADSMDEIHVEDDDTVALTLMTVTLTKAMVLLASMTLAKRESEFEDEIYDKFADNLLSGIEKGMKGIYRDKAIQTIKEARMLLGAFGNLKRH